MSFLNTAPLIFGFQHSDTPGMALEVATPAECADRLRAGGADIGLVPVAEIARQRLAIAGDCCIACDGAVRSILLVSGKPWREVKTLAGDTSSRTSVLLAQILLRERYGATPTLHPHPPNLQAMLAEHDAALIIGDPALELRPETLPYAVLDLGEEWKQHTGLPMVFAAWAGRPEIVDSLATDAFAASRDAGLANLEAIVEKEAPPRGIPGDLAMRYLRDSIRYSLGARERQGMREFLTRARRHGLLAEDADMATLAATRPAFDG